MVSYTFYGEAICGNLALGTYAARLNWIPALLEDVDRKLLRYKRLAPVAYQVDIGSAKNPDFFGDTGLGIGALDHLNNLAFCCHILDSVGSGAISSIAVQRVSVAPLVGDAFIIQDDTGDALLVLASDPIVPPAKSAARKKHNQSDSESDGGGWRRTVTQAKAAKAKAKPKSKPKPMAVLVAEEIIDEVTGVLGIEPGELDDPGESSGSGSDSSEDGSAAGDIEVGPIVDHAPLGDHHTLESKRRLAATLFPKGARQIDEILHSLELQVTDAWYVHRTEQMVPALGCISQVFSGSQLRGECRVHAGRCKCFLIVDEDKPCASIANAEAALVLWLASGAYVSEDDHRSAGKRVRVEWMADMRA